MSLKDEFWEDNHKDCPWHDRDKCDGQVEYNGHINDPRYAPCEQHTCPIFFWIVTLHEHRPNFY